MLLWSGWRPGSAWRGCCRSSQCWIRHRAAAVALHPETRQRVLGGEGWLALKGGCLQEAGQAGMQALGERLPGSRQLGAAGLQVLGGVYQLAAAPGSERS